MLLTYTSKSEAAGYSETAVTVNLHGEKAVTLTRPGESHTSISYAFAGDDKAGRFRMFRLCSVVTLIERFGYSYRWVKYSL